MWVLTWYGSFQSLPLVTIQPNWQNVTPHLLWIGGDMIHQFRQLG
jgi:hypothetical protein